MFARPLNIGRFMLSYRKKDVPTIEMLMAARPGWVPRSRLAIGNPTLRSMLRRKIIAQEEGRFRIHPRVELLLDDPKPKEQRKHEFEEMKKKLAECGCKVNVYGKKNVGVTVVLLTDGGRLYRATGATMTAAAKEVFDIKYQHEAIKDELDLWRNDPEC